MALDDNALTTLANTKLYLGVSNDSKDGLLTELINKATGFIENYCDRVFKLTSYAERLNGTGTDTLLVKNYPIIGSVTLQENTSGDSTEEYDTIATDDYFLFDKEGYIQLVGGKFAKVPKKYKVTYEAGFRVQGATVTGSHVALPHELELACWKLVAAIFNTIGSEGTTSQRLGNYGATFSKTLEDDPHLTAILDSYRSIYRSETI